MACSRLSSLTESPARFRPIKESPLCRTIERTLLPVMAITLELSISTVLTTTQPKHAQSKWSTDVVSSCGSTPAELRDLTAKRNERSDRLSIQFPSNASLALICILIAWKDPLKRERQRPTGFRW